MGRIGLPKKRRHERKNSGNNAPIKHTPNLKSQPRQPLPPKVVAKQPLSSISGAVKYNLRTTASLNTPDIGNIRSIAPPGRDVHFETVVSGPILRTHTIVSVDDSLSYVYYEGAPTNDLKQQRINHTLLLMKQAPLTTKNLIRKCTVVSVPLHRMFLRDSFFHTNSTSNKFRGAALTKKGHVDIDFGQIFNVTLPTSTIGFGKGKNFPWNNSQKKGAIVETPLFCEYMNLKETPQLMYDTINTCPFYHVKKNQKVKLIRIGDYLTPGMVINAIAVCNGNFYNLAVILLIACHNRYHYFQSKNGDEDDEDIEVYVKAANELGDHLNVVIQNLARDKQDNVLRHGWRDWNVMVEKSDSNFNEQMKDFRRGIREKYVLERGISSDDSQLLLEELSLFSYVLIMLGSEGQLDERCEETYYKLINGRHDPMSFLIYLQKASIEDFFYHMERLYHGCGMENLKAHSIIEFLIGLQVVYDGKVNHKQLLHFPEIGLKKYLVALNGFGMYRGVGADTHVINIIMCLVDTLKKEAGKSKKSDNKCKEQAIKIAYNMSRSAGIDFNDNVGELAQQIQRGNERGRNWSTTVYTELAVMNQNFRKMKNEYVESVKSKKK